MNGQKRLPLGAKGFLWVVALGADGTKILLDFALGIGFILDPVVISPVTLMIFMITFSHNNVPMFSGRRGAAGWTNLVVAEAPGIDVIPDWTFYMLYMSASEKVSDVTQGIM